MLSIGICTRERPQMLADLLESLCRAIAHAKVEVAVILVENGPPTGAKDVAAQFADRLTIAYYIEPKLGLVHARNAVLQQFVAGKSTWLAFVDDDETVAVDWLSTFLKAQQDFPETEMFVGPTWKIYSDTAPRILREMKPLHHPYGQKFFGSGTNNCLLKREIIDDGKQVHLFDLKYNFTGGEDAEYFKRIKARGFTCRYIMAARTEERVPKSRETLAFQMGKWRSQSMCRGMLNIQRNGPIMGRVLIMFEMLRDIAKVIAFGSTGTVVLVFSETQGLKYLARALHSASAMSGRPKSLWARADESYETVQGH